MATTSRDDEEERCAAGQQMMAKPVVLKPDNTPAWKQLPAFRRDLVGHCESLSRWRDPEDHIITVF